MLGAAALRRSAEGDFYRAFRLKAVGEGRSRGTGRGGGFAGEGVFEGAFDELGAVDFHRREGAERRGEVAARHRERLLWGFAFDHLGRHAGYGDGGLAAEGLEARLVDDASAFFIFAEFNPHPEHVAAIAASGSANRIGAGHFPEVLGIADRLVDFFVGRHSVV